MTSDELPGLRVGPPQARPFRRLARARSSRSRRLALRPRLPWRCQSSRGGWLAVTCASRPAKIFTVPTGLEVSDGAIHNPRKPE